MEYKRVWLYKEGNRMGFRGITAGPKIGALALTLALGLVGGPAARAQDTNPGHLVVARVDLVDADLQQAIQLLRQQTGVQIVMEASDKPFGRVTLSLENKNLDFVLNFICRSAGASMKFQDGVYVIGPKEAAVQATPEPARQPEPEPIVRRKTRVEKIRLQNTRPTEILQFFGINQGQVNDLLTKFNYEDTARGFRPYDGLNRTPNPIQNLNAAPAPSVPPVVPTSAPNTAAAGEAGRSQGPGNSAEQLGIGGGGGFGGGRGGGGMGGGGFGGGGLGGGGLGGGQGLGGGGRGGQGLGGAGGGQLAALLPDGTEAVIGYDLDNSIIVVGTDEAIRELKQRINLLDIAPKQVMIRAEFVSVRQNDLRTFGIDWNISRGNMTAGNSGFAGGPIFLNFASGNAVAALRATLQEDKGRVVNSPMITTLNNVPVTISFEKTTPVFLTSPIAAGNGTVVLQTTLVPVTATTGLIAIPRINGDESISLFVMPIVQDVTGTVTGPDGTSAPIIESQFVPVNRRIRNGETVVIGGLLTKNDVTTVKRVPLLGDLPLVGNLFRSRDVTVNDTELLVFITPSIIRDTVAGGGTVAPGSDTGANGRVQP